MDRLTGYALGHTTNRKTGRKVHLNLNVGQKIYYVGRGPCFVEGLIRKSVCGASALFYNLTLLDDSKTEFLVPASSCSDLPGASSRAAEPSAHPSGAAPGLGTLAPTSIR